MSTESETKSAGVPAGATHVCTVEGCGIYYRRVGEGKFSSRPPFSPACMHPLDAIRPIAEAGPAPTCPSTANSDMIDGRPVAPCGEPMPCQYHSTAPTTAAPAEQPDDEPRCQAVTRNGHRCDKPPHEEADDDHEADNAAEGGATLVWRESYLPAESAAPAEQLSGKVVCAHAPYLPHPKDNGVPGLIAAHFCLDPRPAEQPGKAADPRPAHPTDTLRKLLEDVHAELDGCSANDSALRVGDEFRQGRWCTHCDGDVDRNGELRARIRAVLAAQPQAPAEPSEEQIEAALEYWMDLVDSEDEPEHSLAAYAESVAAPLREERDRLAGQLAEAKKREWAHGNQIRHEQERWITAEAERDRLARELGEARSCGLQNEQRLRRERDAERAKVAERDARIGKLEKSLQAYVTFHSGHVLPPELGKVQTEARAALGAPEGQPRMVTCEHFGHVGVHPFDGWSCVNCRDAAPEGQPPAPPQELLGKEGGDGDLSAASFHAAEDRFAELKLRDESVTGWMWQAADDAQRLLAEVKRLRALVPPAEQAQPGGKGGGADELREIVKLLLEVIDHAESKNPHSPWCNGVHADSGACEGEYRIAEICADARNILNRSAPPRKAPQEDAAAKLASVREYVAYMFAPASLDELHMRGTFAAGVWKCIRPSSPEEQLSEGGGCVNCGLEWGAHFDRRCPDEQDRSRRNRLGLTFSRAPSRPSRSAAATTKKEG